MYRYGRKTTISTVQVFYFTDIKSAVDNVHFVVIFLYLAMSANLLYLRTTKSSDISVGQVTSRACQEFKSRIALKGKPAKVP